MKIIKYILLFIALFLIGGYFWVNSQPDAYNVKQTKFIKAPSSVIFNNINDFKNWKQWGPWYDEDDSIKETYPEQTAGVGGAYSWTSKQGKHENDCNCSLQKYYSETTIWRLYTY